METQLCQLNEFELIEIEGGVGVFVIVACCSVAFATGLATALMII